MNWNWELTEILGKTAATLIAIAVAGYKAYDAGIRDIKTRNVLKREFEILKLIPPDQPEHQLIRNHISRLIQRLYEPPPPSKERLSSRLKKWQPRDVGGFVAGLMFFAGFAVWTALILRDGFSWWSLLTGFMALSGLGTIADSLKAVKQRAAHPKAEVPPPQAADAPAAPPNDNPGI